MLPTTGPLCTCSPAATLGLDADAPRLDAGDGHRMLEHGILHHHPGHGAGPVGRQIGIEEAIRTGGSGIEPSGPGATSFAPTISPKSSSPVGTKPMRR